MLSTVSLYKKEMGLTRLFVRILILFIIVSNGCSSRFRNKHVYQPKADLEVLESLDDDLYEELINELPILRQVLIGDRKKKTLQVNESALGPYVSPTSAPYVPYKQWRKQALGAGGEGGAAQMPARGRSLNPRWRTTTAADARRRRTGTTLSATTEKRGWIRSWLDRMLKRRSGSEATNWKGAYPVVISCYACGLNESLLPTSRLCHSAFESDDGSATGLTRLLRARCHFYDKVQYYDRILPSTSFFPPFLKISKSSGVMMDYYGPYLDGCFKRFVDVGPLYTQRGCRGYYWPWRAYYDDFAAHRLQRLEFVARGHADVCVHSPHASLTPFSRSVSLFVRYHVCVCDKPFCNCVPPPPSPVRSYLLFASSCIILFSKTCFV